MFALSLSTIVFRESSSGDGGHVASILGMGVALYNLCVEVCMMLSIVSSLACVHSLMHLLVHFVRTCFHSFVDVG